MLRNALAITLVAFSLQACFKGDASTGTCTDNSGCATGSTCNLTLHVCEYACPQLCAANEQCVGGACVALDCLPACDTNHFCDKNQTPPKCLDLTNGTALLVKPAASAIIGSAQVTVEATAGAPGTGPTHVGFRIEQGGAVKSTLDVPTGSAGDYTGTLQLAGKVVTGPAKIFATTYYTVNGTDKSIDSAPVDVTVDEDAPVINAPRTDQPFYSSTAATPAPSALVTVQINDIGAAGINQTSVKLQLPGHAYSPATAPSTANGQGAYSFAVPVGDVGVAANQQATVGYLVVANDTVGNAGSFDGGGISVDNVPPVFSNIVVDATTFYGGDAGIPATVDVSDPAGGSGLDSSSVAVLLADGTTKILPASTSGATRTFALTGAALQADQQQGPVTFKLIARDNVANAAASAVQTVKVDRKPPTVGAATAPATYVARDGSSIAVTVPVDDGATGSGVASASLFNTAGVKLADSASCAAGTCTFNVSTNVQTALHEDPIAFTITATDNVGNTAANVAPAGNPKLLIDDLGPSVGAPTIVGGTVGQDGNKWFAYDATAKLDISAVITDAGSGLKASSIQLQDGIGTRLDDGSPTLSGSTYTFHVARSLLGVTGEGTVSFKIVAQDNLAHAQQAASTGIFGLDGAKPVITVSATYPAAGSGCSADVGVYCGHDGSHFWRNEAGTVSYTVKDNGVGVSAANGTCTVPGSVTGCNTASFTQSVTLNGAVTTDTHGIGTITVNETGTDLLNNSNSGSTGVAITRAKWVRTVAVPGLVSLAGSPVLTSLPVPQLIIGGTNNVGDPIVSISTAGTTAATLPGAKLWSTGHSLSAVIGSVTSNMAYDPTSSSLATRPTPVLYVNSSNVTYALHVTASGIDQYCTSTIGAGPVIGSPAMLSGGSASRVVVAGDTNAIAAVSNLGMGASGGSCSNRNVGVGTSPVVGPPSVNGTTVYFGYDNTANVNNDLGIGSVTFSSGNFGTPVTTNLGFTSTNNITTAAIAAPDDLFFGNNRTGFFYRYGTNGTPVWASTPSLSSNIYTQPTLSGGLVFGTSNGLYAYAKASGAKSWAYPTNGGLTQATPPTFGADGSLYFSDSRNNEIVAIDNAQSPKWTYVGSATTTPVTTLSSIATEAAMGTDGTLYFGDSNGKVYALITDTTPAATAAGDWPRTGFDNCNSGNASNPGYTCQ
jgi:hypothetical protein